MNPFSFISFYQPSLHPTDIVRSSLPRCYSARHWKPFFATHIYLYSSVQILSKHTSGCRSTNDVFFLGWPLSRPGNSKAAVQHCRRPFPPCTLLSALLGAPCKCSGGRCEYASRLDWFAVDLLEEYSALDSRILQDQPEVVIRAIEKVRFSKPAPAPD